ncbi:hypothetical protein [Pseudomonas sp. NA-150]|uniref:hypothetical protein n=1 Tax=Pseudomonas sp. NA-150 TaxID=3367525 RepID=UPI0037C54557
MFNSIDTKLRISYPPLSTRAVVAAALPVLVYAAGTQSTLPLDLINSLDIHEFTGQELFGWVMGAYALGLMNTGRFDRRLRRKHAHDISRFDSMVEIERLAGDRYPLAAQHAREEQRHLRNCYGSLLDARTENVMAAIGVAIKSLIRFI